LDEKLLALGLAEQRQISDLALWRRDGGRQQRPQVAEQAARRGRLEQVRAVLELARDLARLRRNREGQVELRGATTRRHQLRLEPCQPRLRPAVVLED